jgi:hypothetical protein
MYTMKRDLEACHHYSNTEQFMPDGWRSEKITHWLNRLAANFHDEGFIKLAQQLDKCLNHNGDYLCIWVFFYFKKLLATLLLNGKKWLKIVFGICKALLQKSVHDFIGFHIAAEGVKLKIENMVYEVGGGNSKRPENPTLCSQKLIFH